MLLRALYDEKLAQASYLLGCQATGHALVVDPNRDIQQYQRLASKEGLRITHVTETHIHADFVSGTRELAHATGAKMYLSGEGGDDWKYQFAAAENAVEVRDGDIIDVGNIRVQVMHTPGHTPEHIIFVVTDTRSADKPMGIFTGDFIFVGDVGRPDLLETVAGKTGSMRDSAIALFQSLQRFRQMPDYLQVWPGHGAGSACGKALGAVPQTTVGYEKLFNAAFSFTTQDEFADYILAGQPDPPRYFAQMKRINRAGPSLIGEIRAPAKLDALPDGVQVVDTRSQLAYGRGHLRGAINVPYNRAFTNWAGAVIPYDRDFTLIVDERAQKQLYEMVRDLALIGLDRCVGYAGEEVLQGDLETLDAVTTADMEKMNADAGAYVLDVRTSNEWREGHIPNVPNIPLQRLADRVNELPKDKKIAVHCEGGGRAAIAASVLQSLGFDVANVRGGYREWSNSGRPTDRHTGQDTPKPSAPQ
jgi:hydroxyacylglutathione hydrolase